MQGAMEAAGTTALVTQLLGVAVAVLTGQAGAAAGIGAGGYQVAERSLLSFSRGVEQSADQAGVNFLDQAGYSSRGMLEFLDILSGQDLLQSDRQDAYVRTHPLTRDRIAFVQNHVDKSSLSRRVLPDRFKNLHRRMVVKLDAFIDPPLKTLQRYREEDKSLEVRYARAIALYRHADLTEASRLIDGLIREHPKDPYFHELKGQMMFENGRFEPALEAYRESVRLLPNAPLLRTSLAHVELEMQRPDLVDEALSHAQEALRVDPFIPMAWRLAGMAHDHRGDKGLAAWSLAEYNILLGRNAQAAALAKRAMRLLKQGEPAWIRSQDILTQTENKS
jgi:predicted Zn-dependent protease